MLGTVPANQTKPTTLKRVDNKCQMRKIPQFVAIKECLSSKGTV